jgi:putative DeoR family transcriptional regulator (stage III sporulation protein D)
MIMHNFDPLFQTRCEVLGNYILENKCTVRIAAAHFGISKSTVHKDVTKDLRGTNAGLYFEVQKVLQQNKDERHLRGGEATRKKYKNKNKKESTIKK